MEIMEINRMMENKMRINKRRKDEVEDKIKKMKILINLILDQEKISWEINI
jgi:hypothetical protein